MLDASTTTHRTLGESTSITVGYGGILRVRSPENYSPQATFNVSSNGVLGIAVNVVPPITADSGGCLGIDVEGFDAITSLATLGNGSMALGSTASGSFIGASLAPGSGNTYRLGGGGGRLVIVNPVLKDQAQAASLLVGGGPLLSYDKGVVVLHGDNTYSGTTTIQIGALEAGDTGRVLGNSTAVSISSNGRLRLLAPSNYASNASFTVNGVLGVAGKFIPSITASSGGTFAIDTEDFDLISNLAELGNGSMSLSSMTSGTLSSANLLPGSGNVYRFGGGGGALTVLADLTDADAEARSISVSSQTVVPPTGTINLAGAIDLRGSVSLSNQARLILQKDSRIGSVSIATAATLELTGGDLAITGGELGTVNALVKNGRISSSALLDVSDPLNQLRTLAVLRRPEGGVLLRQTWAGDLNGDRIVNGLDYFLLDKAYLSGLTTGLYADGDLDLNGRIDGDDFFTIDRSFRGQAQLTPMLGGSSAVPEPGALALLPLAGLLLVRSSAFRRPVRSSAFSS